MPYYPDHTFILGLTTIRRERRLPPSALGHATARDGSHVEAQDIVLTGSLPGDFMIVDALEPLGLKKAEQLTEEMINVQAGNTVEKGRVLAQNGKRMLRAPVNALIAQVDNGQIILQANPVHIDIEAMCPGEITSVRGNTEVLLETVGALIQCAWGNGKRAYSQYKMEPEGGIETMPDDSMLSQFRNNAVILNHPIQSFKTFSVAVVQEMTAIVAPSMRADLREMALRQPIPIILTEGFGDLQMSDLVYNLLRDNVGRPAMYDASEPERWSPNRPEIVIPLPYGGSLPPSPETDQPLTEGAQVRMRRAPYPGMSGRVRRLVDTPRAVENGLRLPGAEVQLSDGRTVFVPLANLELLGRAADAPGTGGA